MNTLDTLGRCVTRLRELQNEKCGLKPEDVRFEIRSVTVELARVIEDLAAMRAISRREREGRVVQFPSHPIHRLDQQKEVNS